MAKLGFNAEMVTNTGKQLKVNLELYIFAENNVYVIYCSSFDLTAAGKTIEDAKNEFKEIFRLHIEYCINKKTLFDDLSNHGWIIKKTKAKAPNVEQMLSTNNTLKDIIFNKNYQKISHSVQIPAYA
ncbi:MAG: hypothetical protein LBT27_05435 [Prevotellaceae bacterium]|jgi:predicted RNase H-like HicB family nuclease|nr:hypothetical protein [Prevotellaceae bacterium]